METSKWLLLYACTQFEHTETKIKSNGCVFWCLYLCFNGSQISTNVPNIQTTSSSVDHSSGKLELQISPMLIDLLSIMHSRTHTRTHKHNLRSTKSDYVRPSALHCFTRRCTANVRKRTKIWYADEMDMRLWDWYETYRSNLSVTRGRFDLIFVNSVDVVADVGAIAFRCTNTAVGANQIHNVWHLRNWLKWIRIESELNN